MSIIAKKTLCSSNVAVNALGFSGDGGDKRLQAQTSLDIFQGGVFPGAWRRIRRDTNLAALGELLAFDLSEAQPATGHEGGANERALPQSYGRSVLWRIAGFLTNAGWIEAPLKAEVAELTAKAEAADKAGLPDGLSIPDGLRGARR